MADGKFVAYYRTSTKAQDLGIEAQRAAVATYLNGGNWNLIAEFEEQESGRNDARVELAKAIAACKKHKAVLVIAKMDRLSRDLAFIANLMKSGVEFRAVDNPHANKLTIHIMAAVAEEERDAISKRTKAALQALKATGRVKLGNPNAAAAAALGREKLAEKADERNATFLAHINAIKATGITTVRSIASALNARGIKTARGGEWTATQVHRVLTRTA